MRSILHDHFYRVEDREVVKAWVESIKERKHDLEYINHLKSEIYKWKLRFAGAILGSIISAFILSNI